MSELITWQTCLYTLSNAHFNASYEHIQLLIASLVCFLLYYLLNSIHSTGRLSNLLSDEKAEQIAKTLIFLGVILLTVFIVWHAVFFRADAVQAQVDNLTVMMGRGDLPIVSRVS